MKAGFASWMQFRRRLVETWLEEVAQSQRIKEMCIRQYGSVTNKNLHLQFMELN